MAELLSAQFLLAHPRPKQFGHQITEVTFLVEEPSLDLAVQIFRNVGTNLDVVRIAPLAVSFSPSIRSLAIACLRDGVWVRSEQ